MKILRYDTSVIIDLFFSFAFMPLLILLGPAHHWLSDWPLFFLLVCIFLYGSYFFLKRMNIPKLLVERRYVWTAVITCPLLIGTWLLCIYPHPEVDFYTPALSRYQTAVRDYNITLSLWLMFSLVTAYALTTSLIKELYGQLLIKEKMENQKNKAELSVFKAQISPHFLFNTLNSLYSLVIGTSEKAEEAFIKFTDILKYTYVTIENDYVPVKEEITYISNYIDLQKLRLNEHTVIVWEHEVDDSDMEIPPMLLLTFVENAFKYGASTSRDCMIEVRLALHKGTLLFGTRNRIMKHSDQFRTDVPVGIENCRARMNTLFPGKYIFQTGESDGFYNVNLKIELS